MRGWRALGVFTALTAWAALASAQPGRRPPSPPPTTTTAPAGTMPGNVRAHVGTDYATHLMRSADNDDRIRGIQRLTAIATPEAVSLLVQSMETTQSIRSDARSLIELARALSHFTDNERARSSLMNIVNVSNPPGNRTPSTARTSDALQLEEGDPVARTELARQIAAIALARSGVDRAFEQLYGAARGGSAGQPAAMLALSLQPPRDPGFFGTTGTTMPDKIVRLLGQLGDLRALELLHAAAKSTDITIRSAALLSLADLGDERAIALARTAIAESDARLRAAAGEALVILGAPERFKAVAALISDEATVAIGVHLSERVYHTEITKLLAAKANDHPDRELRAAAIRALGRSPDVNAAKALVSPKLLGDGQLQYLAALALARSPAPNAMQLVAAIAAGNLKPLGVRAYAVRALVRGERSDQADAVVSQLYGGKDVKDRALAVFVRVALGQASAEDFFSDKEPRIRRAAAMGSLANPSKRVLDSLLAHMAVEPDDTTRQIFAIGLLSGDPGGSIKTTALVDRAESGGADAALSAYALARRADEPLSRKLGLLLGSKDAILRAHTARGLGLSPIPDASGRLANAYAYETDVDVRRAVIAALALRIQDASAPARKDTLELAATLDPDGPTRQAARRAQQGALSTIGAPIRVDAAWLRLTLENGASPGSAYVGSIVRSDGVSVPIVFDEEGYAIVPGVPPGEARLILAPRLPSPTTTTAP